MSYHFPRSVQELKNSPITLVTGTALMATAVLCSYYFMHNAEGVMLLEAAFHNLISLTGHAG